MNSIPAGRLRRLGAIAIAAALPSAPLHGGTELVAGIKDNSFLVEEAYNQDPGVLQHILFVSGSINSRRGWDDRELSLEFTQEWPLFTQAHQLSYTVPYSFMESGGAAENALGEIVLSYRYQALTETSHRPAFAPRLSFVLPTGDTDSNEVGYEVNLPFSKILSSRGAAHFNAGATWMPDVQGESLVSYKLAGSFIYAVSEEFHLMLEAVGSWDESAAEGGGTGREFSALVAPGFRYAFNLENDVQIVAGVAAPVGLTGAAPDYGILLYLSLEHGFLPKRADYSK